MRVRLLYGGTWTDIESKEPLTIQDTLKRAGISTSMVLVVHEDRILPHTTLIKSDIDLEAIDVGSGG